MTHRILEAFTRPHDSVTAIDEIIQFLVAMPALITLVVIVALVLRKLDS